MPWARNATYLARPELAPPGMIKAAAAAEVLDESTASALSKDELAAALSRG